MRRLVRLTTLLPTAYLLWRNRGEVRRWADFGRRLPARARAGQWGDVRDELRLRLRLAADDDFRRDPSLGVEVVDGVATITGPSASRTARRAEEQARLAPGVVEVRFEDPANAPAVDLTSSALPV
jgi:hypothetical protein